MKLIPENEQKVYHAWISLEEAKKFAKWDNMTFEEEVKSLNDLGFAIIDLNSTNE